VMNPVSRPLPTQDDTNIEETQIDVPRVEFETTTTVSKRTKIFHSLDSAATVIGFKGLCLLNTQAVLERTASSKHQKTLAEKKADSLSFVSKKRE
jgi:hypothetical protein